MAARDRGTLLFKVAEAIRARAAELAETDTRNMGKPIVEAEFDVTDAAHCFEYYGGHGVARSTARRSRCPTTRCRWSLREPVGVVGQIIPWNYPLLMAAWKLAPALAAGCTAVLKPAEQTPLSALMLAEIFAVARPAAGRRQHRHRRRADGRRGARRRSARRQDRVHRRRSTPASSIIKSAADTIKRMSIELGGKNPNIVFADADFEAAVDGALFGAFANQGEVCSAGSRLLVERPIYDRMLRGARREGRRASRSAIR